MRDDSSTPSTLPGAPSRQGRSRSRRRAIIEAALGSFAEVGFDRATMEDIRVRSRASTGSIYHHFKNKQQLAAAVYLEGIVDYQGGFLAQLEANLDDAREGVAAMVRYHLGWVASHEVWARYLFQMRRAEFVSATAPEIKQQNQRFYGEVSRWIDRQIAAGRLRSLPRDVFHALLIGPCQDFVCRWLEGRTRSGAQEVAAQLGEAIWRSLCVSGSESNASSASSVANAAGRVARKKRGTR